GNIEHMIAYGPLLADDGREWVGDAMLIERRDRAAVEAMVASAPLARAGLYDNVEIHDWEFGGRR
ncbi:MAG: YciI family protein, partial [Acidimicrobiia bacterium]